MGLLTACLAPPVESPAGGKGEKTRKKRKTALGRRSRRVGPEPQAAISQQTWIMLGCDGAGKTSLIAAMSGSSEQTVPTVGFSTQQVRRAGQDLRLLDVGGGKGIRAIWDSYYAEAHAAVFIVDAADAERFDEARELLHVAYANQTLAGKPLLVVANKQDLDHAVGAAELEQALRLHDLGSRSLYRMAQGSANAGPKIAHDKELQGGLEWLSGYVAASYEQLEERRQRELAEQQEIERKRKEERKARLEAKRKAHEADENSAENSTPAAELLPPLPDSTLEPNASPLQHPSPSSEPQPPPDAYAAPASQPVWEPQPAAQPQTSEEPHPGPELQLAQGPQTATVAQSQPEPQLTPAPQPTLETPPTPELQPAPESEPRAQPLLPPAPLPQEQEPLPPPRRQPLPQLQPLRPPAEAPLQQQPRPLPPSTTTSREASMALASTPPKRAPLGSSSFPISAPADSPPATPEPSAYSNSSPSCFSSAARREIQLAPISAVSGGAG